MCGRDTFFATWSQVREFSLPLSVVTPAEEPVPTWNRAPSQTGWAIVATGTGGQARPMRWGLIPSWGKDATIGCSTINARLESVASKPAFRSAWKHRRCLIPCSGYYEWQRLDDGSKQPFFIHSAAAPVLYLAGLWERWIEPDGHELLSYSIITRDAETALRPIHDRMPLVLAPTVLGDWLHGDADQAAALAQAAPEPELDFHPVVRAVGSPRNNRSDLILPCPG